MGSWKQGSGDFLSREEAEKHRQNLGAASINAVSSGQGPKRYMVAREGS
jgi:hypothetical protein